MAYIGLAPRRGRAPLARPARRPPPLPRPLAERPIVVQATLEQRAPGPPPAERERKVLLLHGTTFPRARAIVERQAMAAQRTFFVLGPANRDLARLFAIRASQRSPREGDPALVLVTLPEESFERLRRQNLIRALPFDAGDRPELRNRRQWVLEPGGVEILNRDAEAWRMVRLRPQG
jgi:hypothetical protein